ncbi:autotransporter domain-containing protein [Hyphomicrobium sp. 1Nfss2.1]|uniref:autotransporter domain-containing protein n=1 Tax=Hyphomicrobium sp. 1Nfss2.1 TaxID=3413936 RepID=UPI003C79D572
MADTLDVTTGFDGNGIEVEPTPAQSAYTLQLGDGTIGNAAIVNGPPVSILSFDVGQAGVLVAGYVSGAGVQLPIGGANATATVNVTEYSVVSGSAYGVFVWTEGAGHDATVNNHGTITATGAGDSLSIPGYIPVIGGISIGSPGIGINVISEDGKATANNYNVVNAYGNAMNVWSGGDATALNEGSLVSETGSGIVIADPLTNLIPTGSKGTATNSGSIDAAKQGIQIISAGDATAKNTADGTINAGGIGIAVGSGNNAIVENDGHIDAGSDGILAVAANDVTVTNTSLNSIVAIGNGITVDAGNDALVTNSGLIDVTNGIGIGALAVNDITINHSGIIDSDNGAGIIAAGGGDVIIRGNGAGGTAFGSVQSDGVGILGIAGGNVTIDSGTVTSDHSTGIGAVAINGGSTVNLHGDVKANGLFGVGSVALDLGSGTGDSIVDLGGKNVQNDGGIGVFSLALGGNSSVTGGGAGTITSADEGVISSAFLGNSTVDVNNVTSGGTGIISTAIGGNSVATAQGDIKSTSGSGIISTAIDGNAFATNNGKVTADSGLYGIAAFSIGGDATATANGVIDPPLIGVSSFTIGNGDATSNVNNTVQAWAVGAYAGNIGGGDVFVNVNPGGSIQSDYLGILATNIGPGDTTVNVKGAVRGYTGTATGDDAINVTNFINNGNISVTSNEDGTLNAGDDAVDVTKIGGSGKIDVTLGADATAADDGVTIFRTLSGVNTTDENNISVSLADGKTLTATNGNGIDISTPFANNDIFVNVGTDSSVLANNGTAVQVTGFSLLGDNNVTITNAGLVQGDGTLFDPTIRVATDGNVNINNTGTIQSDGGSTFASVIQSAAGGSNTVQNDGTITGNMQLAAVGANTVNNTSSTTWNTSGLNLYLSATGNEVNNTSTGTINAGPFTVFAMIGPKNAINNDGEFNSEGLNVYGMLGDDNSVNNTGSFNVTGFTQFLGGNFGGQNLAFNNNGGVLSMQNGTSGYGFVTPVDLGFENYGNDIGDVVQIGVPDTLGNSFNGSGYSRYAIDSFLAAATTSASDLLIVNGDTTGVTALQVNDTNAGPGAYNPTGILVAHIEGNSDPDAFYLEGGPIDKGLFTYDLYRVQVSSFDWLLASTPDQTFFELPHLITAAQNMWHNSAGVWLDRTADLRSAATEKCAMMGSIKDSTPVCSRSVTPGAWAKVLGNTTEREQNYSWTILGKTSTFEVKSNQDGYGIVGGYDFGHETANGAWMIGAMGGYVASSLDFDGSTTDVDYRTGLVGAYATWIEGGLFIDGKVMANIGKYEYSNYTNTGLSTQDKQDVLSVGGVIDTGYRMNYAGGFIEPGATVSYVNAELDNATIYGTTVNFEDGNSLRGRLGLRVGTSFVSGGHKVEPFIGASAWHEFEADNKATLSSGGYDLTAADDAGGTFGEVTGGLNVFSLGADGVSGFVKGNAQFGEDNLRGYAGSAGLRVNW